MELGITIQEAARRSGLTAYTLRYYERIGLIPEVGRDPNGHRSYSGRDLEWLNFLTKLRMTGMPIADMLRYAELARQGDATRGKRRALLVAHRERVRARIAQLTEDLGVLDLKIDVYYVADTEKEYA